MKDTLLAYSRGLLWTWGLLALLMLAFTAGSNYGIKAQGPPSGGSAVKGVELVTAETGLVRDFDTSIDARCPSGKKVIGGGGAVENENVGGLEKTVLTETSPLRGLVGWHVEAAAADANKPTNHNLKAYAICAPVSP